jgi:deazaflavin-dependent oxidoreductase (nitroreductase family)
MLFTNYKHLTLARGYGITSISGGNNRAFGCFLTLCPTGAILNLSPSLRNHSLMPHTTPEFRVPSPVERLFNRIFGFFVGLGLGFPYNYLLQVRGRKSGKIYSTPINLLELRGKRFLVAPRGRTQWVRNAEAAGEVTLKKGSTRQKYRLRPLTTAEKPEILKAYLDTFRREVQRYFPVPAWSPLEAFAKLTESYPAFELQPV